MNIVKLEGNIVKDLFVSTTGKVAKFTLAIHDGKRTDFVDCAAFGENMAFATANFAKGDTVSVEGSIRSSSYTNKSGVKVYGVEVCAEKLAVVQKATPKAETGESAPAPVAPEMPEQASAPEAAPAQVPEQPAAQAPAQPEEMKIPEQAQDEALPFAS